MKKNRLTFLLLLSIFTIAAFYSLSQDLKNKETANKIQCQKESYSGFDMFSKYNLY